MRPRVEGGDLRGTWSGLRPQPNYGHESVVQKPPSIYRAIRLYSCHPSLRQRRVAPKKSAPHSPGGLAQARETSWWFGVWECQGERGSPESPKVVVPNTPEPLRSVGPLEFGPVWRVGSLHRVAEPCVQPWRRS